MKRAGLVFVVGCLLLVMFFHQAVHASPSSRLITVFGLVDGKHLYEDRFGETTIDKAIVNGHTYSDKAPVASFLVVPFYWARRLHATTPRGLSDVEFGVHVGDVVAAAIPFALFGLAVYRRMARALGPMWSSWGALGALFGTSLFNYANVYYSHILSGALFVAAYALCVPSRTHVRRRMFLAGLAAGFAVLSEYPLGTLVVILGVSLLFQPRRVWRIFMFCLGGLGPAVLLLLWNWEITGNPFDFPYAHVTDQFKEMRTAFGMRLPDMEAAWELLFGQYRGLFFYAMPLLVLAPLAFRSRLRRVAAVAEGLPAEASRALLVVLCAAQFFFVASYFKWDGGWCVGPRHLTTLMMLLVYEGAPALAVARSGARRTFSLCCFLGIIINLFAAATDAIPEESFTRPYFQVFWAHVMKDSLTSHSLPVEAGMHQGVYLLWVWAGLFAFVASAVAAAQWRWGQRLAPQ